MKNQNIPKTKLVEFLVDRKYPRALRIPPPEGRITDGRDTRNDRQKQLEDREELLKEIDNYRVNLFVMPQDKFLELVKVEKEKEREEIAAQLEEQEKQRFFNLPYTEADFEHWSKTAYWTLEEAVALTFGKEPGKVNWGSLKNYTSSPFVEKYRKVRELARRAKNFGNLYDPCPPGLFLGWARRNEIDVPPELIQKIEAQGIVIADWKDLYDELKERYESLEKAFASKVEQSSIDDPAETEKDLKTTERHSRLTIIAALCKHFVL